MPTPAQDDATNAEAFAQLNAGFYRRPNSEVTWQALQHADGQQLFQQGPTVALVFIRIAEYYPEVRERLQSEVGNSHDSLRAALELILNPPADVRDAAYLPDEIQSPGEMDLCWAEFLVTGNTDSIAKVFSVLDREDRSRAFINDSLALEDEDALTLTDEERATLAQVGIHLGLTTDEPPDVVMSQGDTDLRLWYGLKGKNKACEKVTEKMPQDLVLHLACKGAAVWSLQANAAQHGKIRLLCDEQTAIPGGEGRILINPA